VPATHSSISAQQEEQRKVLNCSYKWLGCTVTSVSIRVQPVSSVAAASVVANGVMAILVTLIRHLRALIDIITPKPVHVEAIPNHTAAIV
jgi:hypothetical protein